MKSRESCKLIAKKTFYESFKRIAFAFCAVLLTAVLPAHATNLPTGYTELEYIQSTGTQYIDTGYKKSQVTDVNVRLSVVQFSDTFQLLYGLANDAQCAINSTGRWVNYGGTASTSASLNVWYNTKLDYTNKTLYIDGTPVAASNTGSNSGNIHVFNNTNYKTYIRVSSVEIHDLNGNIVASFVPARRESDGVLGMYDLVSGQFFTNAGTGSFTAGPAVVQQNSGPIVCSNGETLQTRHQSGLPLGYTLLDYIKTTGTQYIDTGINNTGSIGFESEVSAETFGTELGFFATSTSSSGPHYVLQAHSGGLKFYWGYGSGPLVFTTDHNMHLVSFNTIGDQKAYTDGFFIGTVSTAFPSEINYPFYLFARDVAGSLKPASTGQFTCKYFKIYRDGNLIAHFIPAKDSNNIIGMYDLVSGQFFTNAGTGTFIAGDPVSDPETTFCASTGGITIATTKYTEDAFAGLMTTLSEAITKVTNIVDTTVAQANSIGELAQTKQDRPADGDCPAGRKCLLVTGTDGKPHWYLIQE